MRKPASAAWRMWWCRTKSDKGIAQIATGTWLFPADISGTQTRINIQFAPLFLGSTLSQQLGTSKREIQKERGADGWSFFRGNWLSQALFKMAVIQKGKLFWCAAECEGSGQMYSTSAGLLPSSVWAAPYILDAINTAYSHDTIIFSPDAIEYSHDSIKCSHDAMKYSYTVCC